MIVKINFEIIDLYHKNLFSKNHFQMSFNWNDIEGHSLNKLKDQCKALDLQIDNQSTKREIVQILKNYRNQMNLNKVKSSPLANNSQSSSGYSSRNVSPIHSRMTPISTTKPSYLSSSRKHSSSKHSSHKAPRTMSPSIRNTSVSTQKSSNNHSCTSLILKILLIFVILCVLIFCLSLL